MWVPAAGGRLHPPVIEMLGGSEFRLRQDFCLRQKCLYGANAPPRRAGPHPVMYLFRQHMTRRRGLHIVRDDFFTKVIARSFRRSSSPNRTRFAGLRFGLPPCGRSCFWISASFSSTHAKTKGHPFGCPFVLGSAAQRAASPLGFQCSGSAKPPLRNSRPAAGNLRATRRAAQKGRFTSFDHLHLFRQHRTRLYKLIPSLLLSKPDPLRWAPVCRPAGGLF